MRPSPFPGDKITTDTPSSDLKDEPAPGKVVMTTYTHLKVQEGSGMTYSRNSHGTIEEGCVGGDYGTSRPHPYTGLMTTHQPFSRQRGDTEESVVKSLLPLLVE